MTETDLMDLIERHASCALLHRYQSRIIRALDSGDTDALDHLIPARDDLLDRLDVLRQAAGEIERDGEKAA